MASQEAVMTRAAVAAERMQAAITTLAERAGVEVVQAPHLSRSVDGAFVTMSRSEAQAETLERLVVAGEPKPEIEQPTGEPPTPKPIAKTKGGA